MSSGQLPAEDLDILRTIVTNVADHPTDRKFRRLNTNREKIGRLWASTECRAVLEACGFEESGGEKGRLELAMGEAGTRAATIAKNTLGNNTAVISSALSVGPAPPIHHGGSRDDHDHH